MLLESRSGNSRAFVTDELQWFPSDDESEENGMWHERFFWGVHKKPFSWNLFLSYLTQSLVKLRFIFSWLPSTSLFIEEPVAKSKEFQRRLFSLYKCLPFRWKHEKIKHSKVCNNTNRFMWQALKASSPFFSVRNKINHFWEIFNVFVQIISILWICLLRWILLKKDVHHFVLCNFTTCEKNHVAF